VANYPDLFASSGLRLTLVNAQWTRAQAGAINTS